ncbi:low molecular weight protein-tyrosine-phosphatase [Micrococcus sp.]|uniref:low molecular weight protein-tyrosine-phosphatase n=1 Tax=Micrococcus sp. TaxID=1271 RepID=UPI002A91EE35|nr:low molecular weight protein-tyrosine-phosphatase [Micrococcus sp.]MDY6055886.1 low molecular weight protein-tyrosine-phosphatase [Micrococcus sp.]
MRIMTVCLGNICRSPAAEAVLRRAFTEAGLDDVEVTSAGTADYHVGERPHELTLAVGTELGYEFPTVGAQVRAEDLDTQDLLLVMDESNLADVQALAPDSRRAAKVRLLGEFASDAATAGVQEVPDPWGKPRPAFEAMYRQIEDAAAGVVAAVRERRVAEGRDGR